jgi:Protein of unknown function (DUF2852)
MMTTDTPAPQARGFGGFLTRTEAWLDSKGRGAWIAAMVLGFIFFWPIGLALVFYITFTNRWSKSMFGSSCRKDRSASHGHHGHWGHHHGAYRSSGNRAFDAYKAETLRRLEEEQIAFETFLDRLRAAKDKTEFDNFMDDRARQSPDVPQANTLPPAAAATGPVPQSY